MLIPGKQKYRKEQKGRVAKVSKGGCYIAFGAFGLKALGMARIDSRQIEAARVAANRFLQRRGSYGLEFFLIYPLQRNL